MFHKESINIGPSPLEHPHRCQKHQSGGPLQEGWLSKQT